MLGAKSCGQGWTQDHGVTHSPCHLVTMVALVVAVWIELRVGADGSLAAPPELPLPSSHHGLDGVRGRGGV